MQNVRDLLKSATHPIAVCGMLTIILSAFVAWFHNEIAKTVCLLVVAALTLIYQRFLVVRREDFVAVAWKIFDGACVPDRFQTGGKWEIRSVFSLVNASMVSWVYLFRPESAETAGLSKQRYAECMPVLINELNADKTISADVIDIATMSFQLYRMERGVL